MGRHVLEFPSMRYGACTDNDTCGVYRPVATSQVPIDTHADHMKRALSQLWPVCLDCALRKLDCMTKADDGHVRRAAAQLICRKGIPGYDAFLGRMGFEMPKAVAL